MFFNFQKLNLTVSWGYIKKFTWFFCSFSCLLDFTQRATEKCFQWLLHLRRWWKHYAAQWHKKCQYFPSTSLSQPPSPLIPSIQNYSSACYFNIMFWLQRMDFLRSNRCIYKKNAHPAWLRLFHSAVCLDELHRTTSQLKPDHLF